MLERVSRFRLTVVVALLLLPSAAAANLLQSTHFRLDPNVANTVGGLGSSSNYQLTDSGGEAAVGAGSSGSYKLTQGYISQLAHSITLAVMPTGAAAYYPLDTNTGLQAYDVSTNENRGVLTNSPTWTTGKIGSALAFNGSTQYVDVPSSASLNLTGTTTIEAWVNLANYANANSIVTKVTGNGSANNTFELRTQAATGYLQFLGFDTALRTVTSTVAVPTGTWTHVAVTKDATTAKLFINGVLSGQGAVGTTTSNTNAMKLGGRDDLTNYLAGSLDEVKLYSRTLSDAELANDYAAGVNGLEFAHTLPNVTPGTSQTYDLDVIVRTDAGGYDLFIQAANPLTHTDNVTTIPGISGTIALPIAWTEGTTKGLGFSVIAGTQVEPKWGTGPFYYAALPASSTAYHSRVGLNGGVPEKTTLQYRADTSSSQKGGAYSTVVEYTATLKP